MSKDLKVHKVKQVLSTRCEVIKVEGKLWLRWITRCQGNQGAKGKQVVSADPQGEQGEQGVGVAGEGKVHKVSKIAKDLKVPRTSGGKVQVSGSPRSAGPKGSQGHKVSPQGDKVNKVVRSNRCARKSPQGVGVQGPQGVQGEVNRCGWGEVKGDQGVRW